MEKNLFQECKFGEMKLKSRIVRSATGENLAEPTGNIPEDLYTIYDELARGGAGLMDVQ